MTYPAESCCNRLGARSCSRFGIDPQLPPVAPRVETTRPVEPAEARRTLYRNNLRRLLGDSVPVLEGFSSWNKDSNSHSVQAVNDWVKQTSVWICRNMGRATTIYFLDPGRMPLADRFSSVLSGTKAWTLLHVWRENLQDMLEKDTWDPPEDEPPAAASSCAWISGKPLETAFKQVEAQ